MTGRRFENRKDTMRQIAKIGGALRAAMLIAAWSGLLAGGGCGKDESTTGSGDGTGGVSSGCAHLFQGSCMKDLWSADCMPASASGSCTFRMLSQNPPQVEIAYQGGFAMRMSMGGTTASPTAEMTYLKDGKECNKFSMAGQNPEVVFTKGGKNYRMKVNQDESVDYTCPNGSLEHYTKADLEQCQLSSTAGQGYSTQCTMELPGGVPGSSACTKDQDCGQGQKCQSGQCVAVAPQRCTKPTDCPVENSCMAGMCLSCQGNTCASGADCGNGMECANSCCALKEQCTTDALCKAWETCITTIKQCSPRQCKVDQDCQAAGQAKCQLFGQIGICAAIKG